MRTRHESFPVFAQSVYILFYLHKVSTSSLSTLFTITVATYLLNKFLKQAWENVCVCFTRHIYIKYAVCIEYRAKALLP